MHLWAASQHWGPNGYNLDTLEKLESSLTKPRISIATMGYHQTRHYNYICLIPSISLLLEILINGKRLSFNV